MRTQMLNLAPPVSGSVFYPVVVSKSAPALEAPHQRSVHHRGENTRVVSV